MSKRKEHKIVDGVELKHCSKCDQWKKLSEYNKSKSTWDKLNKYCKESAKQLRKECKERKKNNEKTYWKKTKEVQSEKRKEWGKNNKEYRQEYNKNYRKENLEKLRENDRKYNEIRRQDPKYKEWYNAYRREYDRKKRQTDPEFRLRSNVSRRVREMLTQDKSDSAMKYVGCDVQQLKTHLEARFEENMTWENYGSFWHIDHIIPCNSWNLKNVFEQFCCFNYRNLQPLWGIDNITKNDKFDKHEKMLYIRKMKDLF